MGRQVERLLYERLLYTVLACTLSTFTLGGVLGLAYGNYLATPKTAEIKNLNEDKIPEIVITSGKRVPQILMQRGDGTYIPLEEFVRLRGGTAKEKSDLEIKAQESIKYWHPLNLDSLNKE